MFKVSLLINIGLFIGGTILLIYSIEEFIENLGKTAISYGISIFFLSVVLAGMDLENWAIGIVSMFRGVPEFGIGSAIGSALFLAGASLGLAGLVVPFEMKVPKDYLALLVVAPFIFLFVILDWGVPTMQGVTRVEGVLLLVIFFTILGYLYRREHQGPGFLRNEEIEEALEESTELKHKKWVYLAMTLLFALGFSIGAEIAVEGAKGIVRETNINGTIFGMTIVGITASIEEITLTVEPVREGKKEIAIGNLIGSLFFFSTGNIGLLALIKPLALDPLVITFYWPYLMFITFLVAIFSFIGRVKRLESAILIGTYLSYWILSYTIL